MPSNKQGNSIYLLPDLTIVVINTERSSLQNIVLGVSERSIVRPTLYSKF